MRLSTREADELLEESVKKIRYMLEAVSKADPVDMSNSIFTNRDGVEISTVYGTDTGLWETAIKTPRYLMWVIVENYEIREQAEIGHDKWSDYVLNDPGVELTDIDFYGLLELSKRIGDLPDEDFEN